MRSSRFTAHLLLGAILSDTDYLTGSTTTEADRQAVEELSAIAGVEDVDAFYQALHVAKLNYEGMADEEILFSDYKEYEAGGVKFGIGEVAVLNEEAAKEMAEQIKKILPSAFGTRDMDLMYAAMNIRENGLMIDYVVPANTLSEDVLKEAFPDYDEFDGTSYIFRKGLGRKSKFVPGITEALNARPHE